MDGAKPVTDTLEVERLGRKAKAMHRSTGVSSCGALSYENSTLSSIKVGLESRPPKGLGFLNNVRQLRVSRS